MTAMLVFGASLSRADDQQLMITGNITSIHGAIYFSPGDMAASTPIEVITSSPWTTGKTRFRGVLLRDILDKVEADGTVLKATATDGYTVEIPISDAEDFEVIIAYKMDGEWLEEGVYAPFWIIYPYDTDKELAQEKYYGRSIWQLTKLVVE
ncbi:molybdopterin-dependent oxidoreductase [Sneathiella sp.]|uniref:molybdopterin-dependent oxidoreductase n=1 Tax=Sneathiella sp. TaxID=1964365 RepID=UPI002616E9B6|nr:molybdopterin-dependent oxidoreductase [Sneathiella sp.]MDF2365863.1 molybdopterin-dependent oxidoreductase [Sneathiella sp.]